jgi:long-chain acyl-CoA synthetase
LVIAANRNFVSALVALDPEALAAFAQRYKITGDYNQLRVHPEVIKQLESEIETLNSLLNGWEQIKQYRILPSDLTIDGEELTPSLKVRRSTVTRKYQDLIDGIYSASA